MRTNQIFVTKVSERGATCAINGENVLITWADLDEAADQNVYRGQLIDETTEALAAAYRSIRERARAMVAGNRSLPIRCTVHQDSTNVWWVADFCDVAGVWHWIPRAANEHGTLSSASLAEHEASQRAERLRKLGYIVLR